jgi:hypothetical protein
MATLITKLDYSWAPFTVDGKHLSFLDQMRARLQKARCSHWGPVVYKWEGLVTSGPNAGKPGVLVGETGDLRQRVKQYVSGQQESGNKLWRESFLSRGEIMLFVLKLRQLSMHEAGQVFEYDSADAFQSDNLRLVAEQLLVWDEVRKSDETRWIVNARK